MSANTARTEDDDVKILPPDTTLKHKIGPGVDVRELFSDKVINVAQQRVDSVKEDFLEWVVQDLATLEHAYRHLVIDLSKGEGALQKLRRAAFTIKSQAGTFGYDLASQVARGLYIFCDGDFKFKEAQCVVLRKHIDVLNLIFKQKIAGDGGDTGKQIAQEMEKLIAKLR